LRAQTSNQKPATTCPPVQLIIRTSKRIPGPPIVITPDGTRAYVAGYTGIVSVIDTKTNTVVGTISAVVHEPHAMAMTADGTRVYVGGYLGDIAVIDTASNTIVDRTGVSVTATAIAIGP